MGKKKRTAAVFISCRTDRGCCGCCWRQPEQPADQHQHPQYLQLLIYSTFINKKQTILRDSVTRLQWMYCILHQKTHRDSSMDGKFFDQTFSWLGSNALWNRLTKEGHNYNVTYKTIRMWVGGVSPIVGHNGS